MPLKEWELEALEERVRTEMGSSSGEAMKSIRTELVRLRRVAETVRLPHIDRVLLHEFTVDLVRAAKEETHPEVQVVQAKLVGILTRVLNTQNDLHTVPEQCASSN